MRGPMREARRSAGALWRNLLAGFCRDESGGYLIIAGLTLPALLGVVSLGTESGVW